MRCQRSSAPPSYRSIIHAQNGDACRMIFVYSSFIPFLCLKTFVQLASVSVCEFQIQCQSRGTAGTIPAAAIRLQSLQLRPVFLHITVFVPGNSAMTSDLQFHSYISCWFKRGQLTAAGAGVNFSHSGSLINKIRLRKIRMRHCRLKRKPADYKCC